MNHNWHTISFAQLTLLELYALLRLRQQAFVVEQNCAYLDLDGLDQQAMHMLCKQEEELVAYQRCLAPGLSHQESSLGRIVVATTLRGQQMGRELVQRGIDFNLSQWPESDILINAQAHLQDFYATLGFVPQGPGHMEDGIPHRHMLLRKDAVTQTQR